MSIPTRIALVLALALASTTHAAAQQNGPPHEHIVTRTVELTVGETQTIPEGTSTSFGAGNEGVIRVGHDGALHHFVVQALRAGTSTLTLIYADGCQTVYRFIVHAPPTAPHSHQ